MSEILRSHLNSEQEIFSNVRSVEPIPNQEILNRLNLSHPQIPLKIIESVQESQWFNFEGGRIIIEARNPNVNTEGTVFVTDADDTLFDTTTWHKKETELLHQMASIPMSTSQEIYELSKILVPGKTTQEKRYTPMLNMALLTTFLTYLEEGKTEEESFNQIKLELSLITEQADIEEIINSYQINSDIFNIFTTNDIRDYVHHDYVKKFFDESQENDVKIIASRGTIEGPLGQIWKMHQSGVIRQKVNFIFYTNDLKTELLDLIPEILPVNKNFIIYDDNPTELQAFCELVERQNLHQCKLIQVRHPKSKRRDKNMEGILPTFRSGKDINPSDEITPIVPKSDHTIYDTFIFPFNTK